MLNTSVNQPNIIASKLDNSAYTIGGGADIDGSRLNEKSFKSRKSTILGNSRATKESKLLIFGAKEAFNLL